MSLPTYQDTQVDDVLRNTVDIFTGHSENGKDSENGRYLGTR